MESIKEVLTKKGFILETKNKYVEHYKLEQFNITCELSKDDITLNYYKDGCSLIDTIFLDDYDNNICPTCLLEEKLSIFIKRVYILSANSIITDALYNAIKILNE